MVMKMTIMAVWFVMAHRVLQFNSKMEAASCSEVLGKFIPDNMASHHRRQ